MPGPPHRASRPSRRAFTKQAITFAAQLQKLKDRGLLVADEARALRYLANISYYRLSGYWATYLDATGQFQAGTTFDDILNLYRFDKKLRLLCLEAMERLEVAFRTQIIYHFTPAAGTNNWYENLAYFKQSTVLAPRARTTELQDSQRLLETILGNPARGSGGELTRARDKEFIADYYRFYHTPANPPAWMALEVLSYGTLFNLFRLFADTRAKISVAKHFKLNLIVLESWMQSLNVVRNKCAHHERFWDLAVKPLITNQGDRSGVWLSQPSATANTNKAYYILSVLHFLLVQITPKANLCDKVIKLLNDHQLFDKQLHIRYMGFPADWQKETMWAQM